MADTRGTRRSHFGIAAPRRAPIGMPRAVPASRTRGMGQRSEVLHRGFVATRYDAVNDQDLTAGVAKLAAPHANGKQARTISPSGSPAARVS